MPILCRILHLALLFAMLIPLRADDELRRAWDVVWPIIHGRDQDKIAAMKSAPVILLAQVQDVKVFSEPRQVDKPSEVGGPMLPTIPLHLAKVSAKTLLNLRGTAIDSFDFYAWVWVSGKHGGPRLFNPVPGSAHILFLKEESGYLHTVGDYPAYDLEVRSRWLPNFVSDWQSGYGHGAALIERIVAVRLKAELESLEETERDKYRLFTRELTDLTSPSFIAGQLNWHCHRLASPPGRSKACTAFIDEVKDWGL